MSEVVVAAFDVDKTLTTRDCVVPFLRRCRPVAQSTGRMVLNGGTLARGLLRRDRDLIKQAATRAVLGGRSVTEVEQIAARFAAEVAESWLRPDTCGRLERHRAEGHRVVLVSASYAIYLAHLGEVLGVESVLATDLVQAGGAFTGDLRGPNCRGETKRTRLLEWIRNEIGDRSRVRLWAYGDSAGDRAMLAEADHPVWVGPEPLSDRI